MNTSQSQFADRRSPGPRRLKEAVLASFQACTSEAAVEFQRYSENDWREILFWLDISGMALYLVDQIKTLEIKGSVPGAIRERLELRLEQNRQRTRALLREAGEIARLFQRAEIPSALMKGITLPPESVPEPALRWQTDLDFLIDERETAAAARILRDMGYTLHATSGDTMEFRCGPLGMPDLANLYREKTQRSVELHRVHRCEGSTDRLARARVRSFDGVAIPALSPADILVQQALHLFKHLCGEHTRLSWVLEFWRHLRNRHQDKAFLSEVRAIAAAEPHGELALSISVWLAAGLFGPIARGATADWMPVSIPDGIELWLRRYARELLLSDGFASKLYLLLRRQLPGKCDLKETARLVIPLSMPMRITQPAPGESLPDRMARFHIEARYSLQRLRFHLFEGIRYGIEALCWEWRMSKVQQR